MSKYSKYKTNCPKKMSKATNKVVRKVKVPTHWIAEAAGCSSEMVLKVHNGERSAEGKKGNQVVLATMILEQESSKLIQAVKEMVQL
jgi:hypothetical protein